jgi:hypothetical protein
MEYEYIITGIYTIVVEFPLALNEMDENVLMKRTTV